MNALISPNEKARYISSWNTSEKSPIPIFTKIGQRVAEVSATPFEVAPPLFWVSCADTVVADKFYYDPSTSSIIALPENAPIPS